MFVQCLEMALAVLWSCLFRHPDTDQDAGPDIRILAQATLPATRNPVQDTLSLVLVILRLHQDIPEAISHILKWKSSSVRISLAAMITSTSNRPAAIALITAPT
jgi:hypothetical protein